MTHAALQAVIGLEIHAQMITQSKIFSSAPSDVFGKAPNTSVDFVDVAFPGMLPVLNEACVTQAITLGLALGGTVARRCRLDRKHYLYPDLPAGYQISQYQSPLIKGGSLTIQKEDGSPKTIRLDRIHIESDAGQSVHDQHPDLSYINFNRAGIGLMEIVSLPELHSPEEAIAYVKALRRLMRYLRVCHGDMEKGHMRVDANVSVHIPGEPFGTRVELKNMNSPRFLHHALKYEIQRHKDALRLGQPLVQETRMFDVATGTTRSMRTKEEAYDYWYFPDPDLRDIVLSEEEIQAIADRLPETPWEKHQRFTSAFGLSSYDADLLVDERETAEFFEQVISHLPDLSWAKLAANWITGELFSALNRHGIELAQCPISPLHLAQLVTCVAQKEVSHPLAKEVFALMWTEGKSPTLLIRERNLTQISDEKQVTTWIETVLERETTQVQQYLSGKERVWTYLIGQVMKESKGKANPQSIPPLLAKAIQAFRP